ncbi:molybdopterin-guanine dinucleotide biosynthesis protein B [Oricola cellulosilytica]|uniref:Molybdopterin-guanine dinucleotide biosynthesis protein B n=1 Tax=Oricola cellulosilytica TaxID=1429082 RepID=A0A4V6N691_9HYPH|nr:molybdopterin-guanine dinucleotide biosynthesis protein B [Oricola cellulosilytica]TCD11818.1 molybdopterin-guanine dinucleotide biosynthesis protein B [Oricola cellulosilytica]
MTVPRIFGVTGWKNSGKTRMTAALVRELTARGWKVSTVKHAHHAFDIDRENTDSWNHRQAGAREVAIVSGKRWAIMHENAKREPEPPLADILAHLSPCDLVLVEGYKGETHEKIEMRRRESTTKARLADTDSHIVAVVSDEKKSRGECLPFFDHSEIEAIASFIERRTGLNKESAA